MKKGIILSLFAVALIITLCSNSSGYSGNVTGSASSSSAGCSSPGCHGSTTNIGTLVELDSAGVSVGSYIPGLSYTVKISATNATGSNLPKFGCQLSLVKASTAGTGSAVAAGTWGTMPAGMSNHGIYLGHNQRLSPVSGTGGNGTVYTEVIPWTAPIAGTGSVKIYGIINAVNNNGTDDNGDKSQFATAVTITERPAAVIVASVSIAQTAGTNPTCQGTSVTFTATPTNGGTAPTYQWLDGSTPIGTGNTLTISTLSATTHPITCVMTSNLAGVTGSPATSNTISFTVNPTIIDSVNITSTAGTICSGTPVTFTAHPFNAGTPTYQWRVGSTVVGTGSTYTSSTLANGSVVSCVMTPTGTCVSPSTAVSNAITMTVNPTVVPTVHISTPTPSVCPNTLVTFTAAITNGGANPIYQWQVNGVNAGTNSNTFSSSTLTNAARVTAILTSNAACVTPASVTSNVDTITVSTNLVPAITISGTTAICAGSADTFHAAIANGGTTPTFAWTVDGNPAGANSSTLILPSVTASSAVACTLTSSSACVSPQSVTSSTLNVSVTQIVTPAISITAARTTTCPNVIDSFTSSVTGQGANPSYQWLVNGNVSGTGSSFASSTLTDGSVVSAVLTSDAACASPSHVTSNGVSVMVLPLPIATLVPSGNVQVCAGDSVTLTASGTGTFHWSTGDTTATVSVKQTNAYSFTITDANGCTASPAAANVTQHSVAVPTITQSGNVLTASSASTYQWIVNDTVLRGADTTQSITMTESGTYHVIAGDGSGCTGTSLAYILTYTADTTHTDTTGIANMGAAFARLYPVPNHGAFIIDMPAASDAQLAIYDIYGKVVYQTGISSAHTEVKDADLATALYLVHITAAGRSQTIRMQVVRE